MRCNNETVPDRLILDPGARPWIDQPGPSPDRLWVYRSHGRWWGRLIRCLHFGRLFPRLLRLFRFDVHLGLLSWRLWLFQFVVPVGIFTLELQVFPLEHHWIQPIIQWNWESNVVQPMVGFQPVEWLWQWRWVFPTEHVNRHEFRVWRHDEHGGAPTVIQIGSQRI